MADPLTIAAITAAAGAGGSVAGGVATGIGDIIAARQLRLTEEEEEELRELEARRKAGQLGLTEEQAGGMEAMFLAEQASLARQQQQAQLSAAAARGPAVSGREVFLEEQARQAAQLKRTQAENIQREEADQQAAIAQEQRAFALQQQEKAAKAAIAQAVAGTIGGALGTAGATAQDVGMRALAGEIDLAAATPDSELLNLYDAPGGTAYSGVEGLA
tara:strand:+ start:2247 stop:2897 length:651 start_codon:yes stop_codon:yes gene_type:complete